MSFKISGRCLATHHKNGKKECKPDDIQTVCASCHMKIHNAWRRRAKMITHEEALLDSVDKQFKVKLVNGVSIVKEL